MKAEYEFTLVLEGITDFSPSTMDALFEAGCDDATVSRHGDMVEMDFDRSAPSLRDAVISAIADVQKAGIKRRIHVVSREDTAVDQLDPHAAQRLLELFELVDSSHRFATRHLLV